MIFQTQCSKFGYALMDMSNVTKLHLATNLLHPMTMERWGANKKPPPPLWWKVAWRMSVGPTWCTTTECLTTTARNLPVVPACRRRDQLGHARPVRLGYSSKRRHRPPMAIALYSSESPMAQNQWESGMCELQNFKNTLKGLSYHQCLPHKHCSKHHIDALYPMFWVLLQWIFHDIFFCAFWKTILIRSATCKDQFNFFKLCFKAYEKSWHFWDFL